MIASFKKATVKWTVAALALTLVVGCSSLSNPIASTVNAPGQTANAATHQTQSASNPSQQKSSTSSTPTTVGSGSGSNSANPSSTGTQPQHSTGSPNFASTDLASQSANAATALLLNMMQLAKQGKIYDFDFPSRFSAKTTNIRTVEAYWGKPDQVDYVAAANGTYATYLSHHIVFGFNKGGQIFEIRSLASSHFVGITINKVKEVLGTPAYDTISNTQEIIGYTAGTQFKIEFIFPRATTSTPNPSMEHYNVLYPQGTGNQMAGISGRQW
ncbi:hypothetical protein CEB3_c10310 [Peptococcaceae bacterium CEB3]|nr:hypothetical protein CEB3_c10310 [Peptococcaceae bacterium CEB3]